MLAKLFNNEEVNKAKEELAKRRREETKKRRRSNEDATRKIRKRS